MPLIASVEVIEFDHTVERRFTESGVPVAAGFAERRTTRRFGVRLRSSDGVVGGYVVLWSAPPLVVSQVKQMVKSLPGRSVHAREKIWDDLNRGFAKTDRIGASAIDIALWDLAGRTADLPIVDLLGRYRDRLPAYVSSVSGGGGLGSLATDESYRNFADESARRGVPAFKIHGRGRGSAADEIAILNSVAEGAAGRTDIMTDPGGGLPTLAEALKLGRACDDVSAYWWEDPMRDNAPFGHALLRERVRTPLLLTEYVRGLDLRMAVALHGGSDFLRADPELDMGITGVMKTAHAAEAIGLDLEVHAAGPAQRHCMAAIRNTNYYELGLLDPTTGNVGMPPVFADDYVEDLNAVGTDGCVGVPEGSGLGVSYDWERLGTLNADTMVIGT